MIHLEQCGCERGDDCTRTTVCAISTAVEGLVEPDPLQEFKDEIIQHVISWYEATHFGRRLPDWESGAKADILKAVGKYLDEKGDSDVVD